MEKKIVEVQAACMSNYESKSGEEYDVFYLDNSVYLGRRKNYDNNGYYNNSDSSLLFVSDNEKMFSLLTGHGWVLSQQAMIDSCLFTVEDYAEFAALRTGLLRDFIETQEIKFEIDIDNPESGVPFQFPMGLA